MGSQVRPNATELKTARASHNESRATRKAEFKLATDAKFEVNCQLMARGGHQSTAADVTKNRTNRGLAAITQEVTTLFSMTYLTTATSCHNRNRPKRFDLS
jgi:hypothetical protein